MKRYADVYKIIDNCQNESLKAHSILTAKISRAIAQNIEGCDCERAAASGVSHDIAKAYKPSQVEPRLHLPLGFLTLEAMGFDDLKWTALTHPFPDLSNLSLVPGYYNPLWDPEVKDKTGIPIKGIWDTFIPEKLKEHEETIYDIIVLIADLMSLRGRIVSIDERLKCALQKYGTTPKDLQTRNAIFNKVDIVEQKTGRKLNDIVAEIL